MYDRILVAYDGSAHADRALASAVELVKLAGRADLLIATVIQPDDGEEITDSIKSAVAADSPRERHIRAEKLLARAEQQVSVEMNYETIIAEGWPGATLVDLAKSRHCDLIIMGSRGMGAVKSLFLGSVSSQVVKNADCAVMIVK